MSDNLMEQYLAEEEEKSRARAARRERMRLEKERQEAQRRRMRILVPAVAVAIVLLAVLILVLVHFAKREKVEGPEPEETAQEELLPETQIPEVEELEPEIIEEAEEPDDTHVGIGINDTGDGETITVGNVKHLDRMSFTKGEAVAYPDEEKIFSGYVLLANLETGKTVVEKEARTRINPASMTKILTVLVAAEHLESEECLKDKVTITQEITDYIFTHDCSAVNFSIGEQIPVEDLFYGTILQSGADAAMPLAEYVAGSQEAFVDLMNEKLKELGISETTHFTNCIGLYDPNHYSTVEDMAIILKAAVENDYCRKILSEHRYTTVSTPEHEDGIPISNWFLRRIEDKDSGGEVLCAKTGFVAESGNCAASYEIAASGTPYICVTADTYSGWRCIYDHVALYKDYAK